MLCRRMKPNTDAFILRMGGTVIAVVRSTRDQKGKLQIQMQAPQEVRIEHMGFDESEHQVQLLKAKEARDGAEDRHR